MVKKTRKEVKTTDFSNFFPRSKALQLTELGFWSKLGLRGQLLIIALILSCIFSTMTLPFTLVSAGTVDKTVDWWTNLPHTIKSSVLPGRTVLLDKNGKRFATIFDTNRVNVKLSQISPEVVNALIATEDSHFYDHHGVDAKGIFRATLNNITSNSKQGASTITQQLVENLRLQGAKTDAEKADARASSYIGKIEEVRYATGIETAHSKKEILESYLNIVYFGNNAYGIEAASQRYFSKHAKNLTVPEAATLIAMMKSPIYYDPIAHPEASRERRDLVMGRMLEESFITSEDYEKFKAKPTKLHTSKPKSGCDDSSYPFYCQLVINRFLDAPEFGKTPEQRKKLWAAGGFVIQTPLDPKAMKDSQSAVDNAMGRSNNFAAASASIEPGTGRVLAIAQNRTWGSPKNKNDYSRTQIVYANTPAMQVGSTFKPITIATALEEGYSPTTKIDAISPAFYANLDEPPGGFKNDDYRSRGLIDMKTAVKYSVNTYFTGLVERVGVKDTASMAARLGMTSVPQTLTGREGSITLGAYDSDPIELSTVYATLAGRGIKCDPVTITSIKYSYDNKVLHGPDGNCHQEISPAIADTIADIMKAPFTSGGTASRLHLGRVAAGKTGTTNGHAAVWFGGFTPQIATTVWVGDPRGGSNHPVEGYGGTVAGPIWVKIMQDYLSGKPVLWYPKPGGVSASMTARVVPEVAGQDLDSAISTLLASDFKVVIAKDTAKPSQNFNKKGYVVSQSPGSGRKAPYGSTITLKLSYGSDTNIQIPDTIEELVDKTKERGQ